MRQNKQITWPESDVVGLTGYRFYYELAPTSPNPASPHIFKPLAELPDAWPDGNEIWWNVGKEAPGLAVGTYNVGVVPYSDRVHQADATLIENIEIADVGTRLTRWVIAPMVIVGGVKQPKFADYKDPGLWGRYVYNDDPQLPPVGPVLIEYGYSRSNVVKAEFDDWALSIVKGYDFTPLDDDVQCKDLFLYDYEELSDFLNQTPNTAGWTAIRANVVRTKLENHGVDITGVTMDTKFWRMLRELGRQLHIDYPGPYGTWVL